MNEAKSSFWRSAPGIIAQIAALIVAVTGLIAILRPKPGSEPGPKPTPTTDSSRQVAGSPEPAAGVAVSRVLVDDADPRVRYNEGGGWKTDPDYHLAHSTQHYTYNPGSTASLDFAGDWLEIDYYRAIGGAIMGVSIDDQAKDQIDCGTGSETTDYGQKRRFAHLGPGSHRLVLIHTGAHAPGRPRSPAAGGQEPSGYAVNIDGFWISKTEN